MSQIENLSRLQSLRELRLAANKLQTTAGLAGLRKLEVLHLQHNQLTAFEGMENLPKLQVRGCGVTWCEGVVVCSGGAKVLWCDVQ